MKFILIKENVQRARKILKSKGLDETNDSYKEIERIVGDRKGFLGLFTYLHFVAEEPMYKLSSLIDPLNTHKKVLHKLPIEVVKYESVEKLMDDLLIVLKWERYNQTFVSRLPGVLKGEARKDSELQQWIYNLGEDDKKDLYDNFLPKVSRYKNYSEFKNDIDSFLRKSDDSESILKSIEDHKDTYLVYSKDGVIVSEVFSRTDSCEIGSSSWCISGNKGTYWEQYAGVKSGNKQYFLWNLNVPSRDIDSQVGITIKPDGNQHTSHLKNDEFVNINKYCEKYNIPREIFKGLDKGDIPKLVQANEMDLILAKKLKSFGVDSEYKHLMSLQVKMILGLLTDEEMEEYGDLDKYKEILYRDNKNEILYSMMYYLNNVKYEEDDDYNEGEETPINDRIEAILHTFSFKDKLIYLTKYQGNVRSWDRNNSLEEFLDDDGLNNLFNKERKDIKEDREYTLNVISDNSDSQDITFEFEDITKEEYNDINELGDGMLDMDYLDHSDFLSEYDEEWEYVHNGFDDDTEKKLIEYLNHIRVSIVHPILLKDFDEQVENFKNNKIDMISDLSDIVSLLDPRFIHSWSNGKSYFTDYMSTLSDSAQDLVNEDSRSWDKDRLGDFEYDRNGKGSWTISSNRILKSMEIEVETNDEDGNEDVDIDPRDEHKDVKSIVEWIDSEPGGLKSDYHFDDYPYSSTYYSQADHTLANKELVENLQETIDGNNEDYEELKEDSDDFRPYNRTIIELGYKPFSEKANYRSDNNWYGYRSEPEDLGKSFKKEEEGEEKEVRTKSVKVIPFNQIYGDIAFVYTINEDISTHGVINYSTIKYFSLIKNNHEELEKMGVEWKTMSLEVPNQLEMKFERKSIKSFKDFDI